MLLFLPSKLLNHLNQIKTITHLQSEYLNKVGERTFWVLHILPILIALAVFKSFRSTNQAGYRKRESPEASKPLVRSEIWRPMEHRTSPEGFRTPTAQQCSKFEASVDYLRSWDAAFGGIIHNKLIKKENKAYWWNKKVIMCIINTEKKIESCDQRVT